MLSFSFGADAGVSTDPTVGLALLKATVTVAPAPGMPASVTAPQLTGHTTGTSDNTGLIDVLDLVVVAEPGEYILNVTLTDFPSVNL